jgi:hypothetical protein
MWIGNGRFELIVNVRTWRLPTRLQFQLQDILAVMVGYGMAALYFRAYWPERTPSAVLAIAGIGFYIWLGMALSGPVALLRRPLRPNDAMDSGRHAGLPPGYTRAELAWLLIGMYWITLGLFALRARLPDFRLTDVFLFGLIPFVVPLALRVFGLRSRVPLEATPTWTHSAAVIVLVTWPLAWLLLIVMGSHVH